MKKLVCTLVLCASALMFSSISAALPGSSFTYQGELVDGGGPANGNYEFEIELFNAVNAGDSLASPESLSIAVVDGVFTAELDFGSSPFTGAEIWLEIRVRPSGGGVFNTLSPRQRLTGTPYAIFAKKFGGYQNLISANAPAQIKNVTSRVSGGSVTAAGLYMNKSILNVTGFNIDAASNATFVAGIWCDDVSSSLNARQLVVNASKEVDSGSTAGLAVYNCDLALSDSKVSVNSASLTYGLLYSSLVDDARVLDVNQLDVLSVSSESNTYGLYINSNEAGAAAGNLRHINVRVSAADADQNSYGGSYGLYLYAGSGADHHMVRGSYIHGVNSTIRTLGWTDLYVVDSQLDGGATSSGSPDDHTTCTSVSYGSAASFSFAAGPISPCP